MPVQLTLEEAIQLVEHAFLPYQCIVTPDKSDSSFSILVSDGKAELLSIAHVGRAQYSNPIHLAALIEQSRLEITRDGYPIEPWSMPFSSNF